METINDVKNKNLLRVVYGMNLDELTLRDICEEIMDVKNDICFADNDDQRQYLKKVLCVLKNYKKYLINIQKERN